MFLGDSEAGKSLIMSRVENPKMNPARFHGNTTIGINIFSRVETIAEQKVRVNYWDFGGQEILHSMHRMFLSEKTIYVIILNTRNDNQDAQADFWLRYVEAYASHAPVMLVLNKIDQNKRASLNLTVLRRQFARELDDSNVLKISAVEKDPKKFHKNFKNKLIEFIERNADCIHGFSALEAQIRDEVERKQEKVFRTYDFMAICQKRGIEENAQYDLLNRFNEAGVLVSFGTTKPMFLNPKWITSLIYKVLDQGDEIADNGVISDVRLSTICENNPAKWKGADDAHFLVQIMVDYDLAVICRKKGTDGKAGSEKTLIPMLCRREEPKEIQELILKDNPVEMRMVFEYLPGGVLYKLIADYNREQNNQLNPDNLWLTGAKFENPADGYTIVRQEGNTMALYVHNSTKSGAVKQLDALSKNIAYIAENLKFNARLNETKISYQIAGVKEYFDYQQLLNAKESGVRLIASTRETDRTDTEKPPRIPVLDIFDQDEGSQKREIEELLHLLLMGCMDLQKDKVFWDVNENARNRQLARALEQVKDKYDVILVDCPPSLELLTLNALCAAESILVPVQCEYYALEGLSDLMSTLRAVKRNLNPKLEIFGVVLTMFDGRTNFSTQVAEEVRRHFPGKVFSAVVPRNIRLAEAPSHGIPVTQYDKHSRGAKAYKAMAEEIKAKL